MAKEPVTVGWLPSPEKADMLAYDLLTYPAENIRKAEDVKNYPFAEHLEAERPTVWAVAIYDIPDAEDGGESVMQLVAFNRHWFSHGICEFAAPFRIKGEGDIRPLDVTMFVEKAYETGATAILIRPTNAQHKHSVKIIDSAVQPSLKLMEEKLAKEASGIDGIIVSPVTERTLDCPIKFVADSPGRWRTDHPDWYAKEHGPDDATIQWPIGGCILTSLEMKDEMVCVLRY
jgi:hypothetical protein